jgi:hypothetical protein
MAAGWAAAPVVSACAANVQVIASAIAGTHIRSKDVALIIAAPVVRIPPSPGSGETGAV